MTVLVLLVLAILICFCCWKVTNVRRLLAPKLKPKEAQLEDFIVVDTGHNHEEDDEHGDTLNLNPVVQMRFLLEREAGVDRKRNIKKEAHAYGALRKLKLHIAHDHDTKEKKGQGLHNVDRALAAEERRLKHELKEAEAIVRKAELERREDKRIFKEAEEAAKHAKKLAARG